MKHLQTISIGLIIGAMSWACSGWFSDRFEPFDSRVGFVLNQLILSFFSGFWGWKKGAKQLLLFLLCAYIGLNSYAYILGGTDNKAWFYLSLITTLTLFVFPFALGFIAQLLSAWQKKPSKKNSHDDEIT